VALEELDEEVDEGPDVDVDVDTDDGAEEVGALIPPSPHVPNALWHPLPQ